MAAKGDSKAEARTPAELRAEIERTRADLLTSVTALREEVSARTDWREWVRRRPLLTVGLAFTVGFWLGDRR
ncbi:DUF3618 domain-containing protein [Myxococcaceae bacterium GXIMD 01537]